jgi:Glycosyltransferase family 87
VGAGDLFRARLYPRRTTEHDDSALSFRRGALIAALVVATFFVAFGFLHYGVFTQKLLLDTPIYEHYGDAVVHARKVPYRDFALEYPPGALPAFAVPSLASPAADFRRYSQLFELLMLVCGAFASALAGALLVLQRASAGRLVAGTLLVGLAPLALGPVVLSRFDLWPAALTLAALAAVVAEHPRVGLALLGAAVAAKVYPVVVLPLVIAYVWRRRGRREALIGVAATNGVVIACLVPFLVLAPDGLWSSFAGQARRPLQIESLGAALLLAAHHAWGHVVTVSASSGSDNLKGRLPDDLAALQSLLVAGAVAALWLAFARGPATRDRLLRYVAGTVCAFVALGKVLSPQYLIWLMPLVPLVRGRRGVAAACLFLPALVLTQLWFPSRYIDLVYALDPRASWLVLARDLVLVALLLAMVLPARRLSVALVGALVLLASAAVGAAAATSSSRAAGTHNGLLNATGVASNCRRSRHAPSASSGIVRYESTAFSNASASKPCVTVIVRPAPGAQLFSAAYRNRLDPGDPRARYLGDAGSCTNIARETPARLQYSFFVPGRARFVVEVEPCDSVEVPVYDLEVRGRNVRRLPP